MLIYVIDPVPPHAAALYAALAQRHHQIRVFENPDSVVALSSRAEASPDFIIVNVTKNLPKDWNGLRAVIASAKRMPEPPAVICVSSVNRGARLRLDIKRLGGRLFYEYA